MPWRKLLFSFFDPELSRLPVWEGYLFNLNERSPKCQTKTVKAQGQEVQDQVNQKVGKVKEDANG